MNWTHLTYDSRTGDKVCQLKAAASCTASVKPQIIRNLSSDTQRRNSTVDTTRIANILGPRSSSFLSVLSVRPLRVRHHSSNIHNGGIRRIGAGLKINPTKVLEIILLTCC